MVPAEVTCFALPAVGDSVPLGVAVGVELPLQPTARRTAAAAQTPPGIQRFATLLHGFLLSFVLLKGSLLLCSPVGGGG